jgi:hypothetical protein
MRTDFVEVYAIPGHHNIIDGINPDTGLTCVNGDTAEQVAAREPLAVRMTWEAWRAEQIARQQTPIAWQPSTRAQYHEMLNVLPPALWIGGAFLVGEPMDHSHATGAPRFTAYKQTGSSEDFARYWVASRPLTVAEFRAELGR